MATTEEKVAAGTEARGGGRGKGADAYRTFEWYTPAKRRPTQYEDMTIDSQPSVGRHWSGELPARLPSGRPVWWSGSTKLQAGDWYDFRDPNGDWSRTYYQKGAQHERNIQNATSTAAASGMFEHFSSEWTELLRENLQVTSFIDYGIWLGLASSQRECLSDVISHLVGFWAGHKQRQFQAVVLYGMELEEQFGAGFEVEHAKERWLEAAEFQQARRYVERMQATTDWGEAIFASAFCLEPLVGGALRRELFTRSAAANGDLVTADVLLPAESEVQATRHSATAFIAFVLADAEHGEANRVVVKEWLESWGGLAQEALDALQPLFEAADGVLFDDAKRLVTADHEAMLAAAGIAEGVPA